MDVDPDDVGRRVQEYLTERSPGERLLLSFKAYGVRPVLRDFFDQALLRAKNPFLRWPSSSDPKRLDALTAMSRYFGLDHHVAGVDGLPCLSGWGEAPA